MQAQYIFNLETLPHVFVLTALMLGNLRLVTWPIISDTKGDTTTTTLLVTILLPCIETVLDEGYFVHVLIVSTRPPFCSLATKLLFS